MYDENACYAALLVSIVFIVVITIQLHVHWPEILMVWPAFFVFCFSLVYLLCTAILMLDERATEPVNTPGEEYHLIDIPPPPHRTIITSHT
jgi:hypothetical protein